MGKLARAVLLAIATVAGALGACVWAIDGSQHSPATDDH